MRGKGLIFGSLVQRFETDTHNFQAVAGKVLRQYDAFKEDLLGVGHGREDLHRLRVCVWRSGRFLWYDQREQCGLHPRATICHRGIPADQEKTERIH